MLQKALAVQAATLLQTTLGDEDDLPAQSLRRSPACCGCCSLFLKDILNSEMARQDLWVSVPQGSLAASLRIIWGFPGDPKSLVGG